MGRGINKYDERNDLPDFVNNPAVPKKVNPDIRMRELALSKRCRALGLKLSHTAGNLYTVTNMNTRAKVDVHGLWAAEHVVRGFEFCAIGVGTTGPYRAGSWTNE